MKKYQIMTSRVTYYYGIIEADNEEEAQEVANEVYLEDLYKEEEIESTQPEIRELDKDEIYSFPILRKNALYGYEVKQ